MKRVDKNVFKNRNLNVEEEGKEESSKRGKDLLIDKIHPSIGILVKFCKIGQGEQSLSLDKRRSSRLMMKNGNGEIHNNAQ